MDTGPAKPITAHTPAASSDAAVNPESRTPQVEACLLIPEPHGDDRSQQPCDGQQGPAGEQARASPPLTGSAVRESTTPMTSGTPIPAMATMR